MDAFDPFLNPFESPDAEILSLRRHVDETTDRVEQLLSERIAALEWRVRELEEIVADLRGSGSG